MDFPPGMRRFWENVRKAIQNKETYPQQFSRYFIGSIVEKLETTKDRRAHRRTKNAKRFYYLGDHFANCYLTAREADCMALMLKDCTNAEVAQQLQLSVRTVEFYIKNMRQKLGCHSKANLIETIRQTDFSYEDAEK